MPNRKRKRKQIDNDTSPIVRGGIIFFTLFLIFAVNTPENILGRYGFDQSLLLATLIAFVLTGFVYERRIALVCLVVVLAIGANHDIFTLLNINLDGFDSRFAANRQLRQDIMLATLVAIVALPPIARRCGL